MRGQRAACGEQRAGSIVSTARRSPLPLAGGQSAFAALASCFEEASRPSFSAFLPALTPLATLFSVFSLNFAAAFLSCLTFGAAAFFNCLTFGAAAFLMLFTALFTAFSLSFAVFRAAL